MRSVNITDYKQTVSSVNSITYIIYKHMHAIIHTIVRIDSANFIVSIRTINSRFVVGNILTSCQY
jgi:hypothetical protein